MDEENRDATLRKFVLSVFFVGWLATIAAFALLMRTLIPDADIEAELDAIEVEDTEAVELDRPLPATLRALADPLPAFAASGKVYLPLYSSLYVGGERLLDDLSATVSLRNLSTEHPVTLTAMTFFNAAGEAIQERLEGPHALAPLATAEIYIDQEGRQMGPVALIVVSWGAEQPIAAPLVEAAIVGSYGAKSMSVLTRGIDQPTAAAP